MADHGVVLQTLFDITKVFVGRGLSEEDRLFVLELAWRGTASNLRNAALVLPGGFPAERARQVERLREIEAIVEADTPDLELERLWLEGDIVGMTAHLKRRGLLDNGEKGG